MEQRGASGGFDLRAEVIWCLSDDLPGGSSTWTDSMEPVGGQQHSGELAPTPKLPQG